MFPLKISFNRLFLAFLSLSLFFTGCSHKEELVTPTNTSIDVSNALRVSTGFPEGFNTGTKDSYSTANVSLGSGIWTLNDALLGSTTSDRKTGTKSVRIRNAGKVSMAFNVPNGITTVTIYHAKYGSDANSFWTLWASQNGGSSWTQMGSQVQTSTTSLLATSFTLNLTGNVRLEIRKSSSSTRMCIDDISINEIDPVILSPTRDDNMALGNPSNATNIATNMTNYLMVKPQFALSYNNSRGGANWVSWHLSAAWKGTATRLDNFAADVTLPSTFYRVSSTAYTGTGFDRGHQCPSDDRDGSQDDNTATFLMTNMLPQAPNANRNTWERLEAYSRTLLTQGNELYIIAGGYGQGGTGANGGVTTTIDNGHITVPAHLWKVIVVLPIGSNDITRITSATRVIAVDMPNNQAITAQPWGYYRTSVDALENILGYDFLSNVSASTQASIESTIDAGATN